MMTFNKLIGRILGRLKFIKVLKIKVILVFNLDLSLFDETRGIPL